MDDKSESHHKGAEIIDPNAGKPQEIIGYWDEGIIVSRGSERMYIPYKSLYPTNMIATQK